MRKGLKTCSVFSYVWNAGRVQDLQKLFCYILLYFVMDLIELMKDNPGSRIQFLRAIEKELL